MDSRFGYHGPLSSLAHVGDPELEQMGFMIYVGFFVAGYFLAKLSRESFFRYAIQ